MAAARAHTLDYRGVHHPPLPSDVHTLAWMLEDPHQQLPEHREPRARVAQEEALGRVLAKQGLAELLGLLGDGRSSVRQHAVRALGRLHAEGPRLWQAAPRVEALLLADPCPAVCQEAAAALGSMAAADPDWRREATAVSTLVRARREDHVEATRAACDEALVQLFAAMPLPELLRFLREGEADARGYAAQTLAGKLAENAQRWRWQVLPPLEQARAEIEEELRCQGGAGELRANSPRVERRCRDALRQLDASRREKAEGVRSVREVLPPIRWKPKAES